MKTAPGSSFTASLPRRDIVAICSYLNRQKGTRSVDGCVTGSRVHLDKLTDAARMQ